MDFRAADLHFAELKKRHDAGELGGSEFDERLKEMMVCDEENRWWSKSRKTGEWYYHDGDGWVRGIPPGYETPDSGRPSTLSGPGQHEDDSRRDRTDTSMKPDEEDVTVPDLSGRFHGQADRMLREAGLRHVRGNAKSDAPKNTAIRQDPAPGTRMQPGGSVSVAYSAGRTSVWVPVLVVGGVLVAIVVTVAAFASGGGLGGDFEDDFSDASSGWLDETFSDGSTIGYGNGTYDISTAGSRSAVATAPAGSFEDVVVQTDASTSSGTSEFSYWGVVCRAEDADNFYVLGVSGNGDAFIGKVEDGTFTELEISDSAMSSVPTSNIAGSCRGNVLTLSLDSAEILEVTDYSFQSGEVGLWVRDGGSNSSGAGVSFNDFSARVGE